MNKRDAKALSLEGKISIGELRAMIAGARSRQGASRVNPGIALSAVCDIYERALAGRADAEVPKGTVIDPYSGRTPRHRPSRDSLIIANILRDCADAVTVD